MGSILTVRWKPPTRKLDAWGTLAAFPGYFFRALVVLQLPSLLPRKEPTTSFNQSARVCESKVPPLSGVSRHGGLCFPQLPLWARLWRPPGTPDNAE